MGKRRKNNLFGAPFLYWLPRALVRVDDLMPYGIEYDWVDDRWPGILLQVSDSDIRGFRETKRQLEACVGRGEDDREGIIALIIAMVRLESHCQHVGLHKKMMEV